MPQIRPAVLACIAAFALLYWRMLEVPKDTRVEIMDLAMQIKGSQLATVTLTWKSGGIPVVFTSTRQPSETAEEWRIRAADECAKLKLAFPPDPA